MYNMYMLNVWTYNNIICMYIVLYIGTRSQYHKIDEKRDSIPLTAPFHSGVGAGWYGTKNGNIDHGVLGLFDTTILEKFAGL